MTTLPPTLMLRSAFEDVDGVDQVLIHGSWAARRTGDSGPFPGDTDVLVIGDVPRRTVTTIATHASEQVGNPVNITGVSVDEWSSDSPTPFVRTVRSRPLVDVRTGAPHG